MPPTHHGKSEDPRKGRIPVFNHAGQLVWIRPERCKQAPLRHEAIASDWQPVLRWQWRHLQRHLPYVSFEEWELGYLRDTNPEREIEHWTRCTYALLTMQCHHPRADPSELFRALSYIAVGREDLVYPRRVRRELLQLLKRTDPRLFDPRNFSEEGRFLNGGHLE